MNRTPKQGDLIYIGKKNVEYLVVDNGCGTQWGDFAWFNAVRSTAADPLTGNIDGDKVKTYITDGGSLSRSGSIKITPLAQLQLVGNAKFKKTTKVTYTITKIKSV